MEAVVDTNIFLPSMCTLLFRDPQVIEGKGPLTHTDAEGLLLWKVGASIEVSAEVIDLATGLTKSNDIFDGEITAIEGIYGEDGNVQLRIRAFDRAHRLTIGKKTRAFGDGGPVPITTEMQIVTEIAGKVGLTPMMVPPSTITYNYVMQYNQTDWDFLWSRAQLLGYQVYVSGKQLYFQDASLPRHLIPVNLAWGNNLFRFEPRILSMGQVNQATAYGWDPDSKKTISSTSNSNLVHNLIPEVNYGSKALSKGLNISKSEDVVVSPVFRTNAAAKAAAGSSFASHDTQFVRASGEAQGNPSLLAGCNAVVTNVAVRFTGTYYITQATHIFTGGDYRVKFEVSGRDPYTMRSLLLGKENENLNRIDSVVIGVVSDVNDLSNLGRVKVKYPWMPKDGSSELSSNWARVASPGGGKERGLFFTPEVDDEVLIAFEQGDVNFPYVVGSLWNKKDKPPKAPSGSPVVAGKVNQRIVRSRSGHVIVLDDTSGKEMITVTDKTGKNTIVIDSAKNSMTFTAQGDITLNAGGKLIMTSKADFSVDSKTKVDIKAATQMKMEATSGTNIKSGSSQVDLTPASAAMKGTKVDIQGTAQTGIQGAQTSVKGTAMVEIQGALVKIN